MNNADYYTKIKRSAFDNREEALLKGSEHIPCPVIQGIEIRKLKKGKDPLKRCRKEFELKQQLGQGVKSPGIMFSCVDRHHRTTKKEGPDPEMSFLAMYIRHRY